VDLDTFIVATYCLVDEAMDELLPNGERLRQRGPDPLLLDDGEVLTIEVGGRRVPRHRHRPGDLPLLP